MKGGPCGPPNVRRCVARPSRCASMKGGPCGPPNMWPDRWRGRRVGCLNEGRSLRTAERAMGSWSLICVMCLNEGRSLRTAELRPCAEARRHVHPASMKGGPCGPPNLAAGEPVIVGDGASMKGGPCGPPNPRAVALFERVKATPQ